jgi:hypothetical protein
VNADWDNGVVDDKILRADMAWAGATSHAGDPVSYLQGLSYLPAGDRAELERIARLPYRERERRAIALARKLERKSLYAVYQDDAIPELVSPRLGCIVHQPEYAGVDLAALCLAQAPRP